MKQTNLQKAQVRLREKFIKNGVKMIAPELLSGVTQIHWQGFTIMMIFLTPDQL